MVIHPMFTSALFGGCLKLFDDIQDNSLIQPFFSASAVEFIKAFIMILLSHMSMYDINFIMVLFITHLIIPFYDKDCFNNPYFVAGMPILAIL
jgi:hypothetical protein